MKRIIIAIALALPLCLMAQEQGDSVVVEPVVPQFGVFDYQGTLRQMPEYKLAMNQLDSLRTKYDAESERAESEFQRKFAEFLEGQKDFPQNIMQKRQKELQSLLDESISFRQSCQRLLRQAEVDLTANARRRLDEAMRCVATENNLLFIFNHDASQLLFVDEERVLDVEPLVLQQLEK